MRITALALLLVAGCTPPAYRKPLEAKPADLQKDSGAHRSIFEWWYWTGHLRAADGRRFGFELTFFDVATPPRARALGILPAWWFQRRVLIGHAALTDVDGKRFFQAEKSDVSRTADKRAKVSTAAMDVEIDGWRAQEVGGATKHHLDVATGDYTIDLIATASKPPALHGKSGVQASGPSGVSYYVSETRMNVTGTVEIGGARVPVEGIAWHDHQWGNWKQTAVKGWDWYGLQLDDSTELMLYHVDPPGGAGLRDGGSFVDASGATAEIGASDFSIACTGKFPSAKFGATYPAGWTIDVPSRKLSLQLTPSVADQEFDGRKSIGVVYWEGAVEIEGTRDGKPVKGTGYVELTNYACAPVAIPDAATAKRCDPPERRLP